MCNNNVYSNIVNLERDNQIADIVHLKFKGKKDVYNRIQ